MTPEGTNSVRRNRYRIQLPDNVSQLVAVGANGCIGLVKSDPGQVLKFCIPEREHAVKQLEQEKTILGIIGRHPRFLHANTISDDGIYFDYHPHGSLRDYYKSLSSLPNIALRFRWCQQVIDALKYLHSKGIVHGDISARNILLSDSLDIKVCDFGYSQREGSSLLGWAEPHYCRFRPETDDTVTVLDDLFAVGCLLYEILSGKRPFEDLNVAEVEARYKERDFPSTADVEWYGYDLIIVKCWNEHYHDVEELERDIHVNLLSSSILRDITATNPRANTVACIHATESEDSWGQDPLGTGTGDIAEGNPEEQVGGTTSRGDSGTRTRQRATTHAE